MKENKEVVAKLHEDLTDVSKEIKNALMVSSINLLFPINCMAKAFFLEMTSRYSHAFYDVTFFVEFCLFFSTVVWIWDEFRLTTPIVGNQYIEAFDDLSEEPFNAGQIFMLNVMY